MRTRQIGSTDLHVTEIGFGCASIGNLYRAMSEDTANEILEFAWQSGIRYFDTAPHYGGGLAEERLGRFVAGRNRDEYAISTKVGRLLHPVSEARAENHGFVGGHPIRLEYDYSGDGIMRSLEESHKRMAIDHFDIVLVHDIGSFAHGKDLNTHHMRAFRDTGIRRLHDLRDEGTIKGWGLGVNEVEVVLDVMAETELDCVLLAGRYTLLDRSAEAELLSLCRQTNTSLVIGGVFNSGILATGPVPGATFNYVEATPDIISRVAAMRTIAAEANIELASLALQFPLRNQSVASVLLSTQGSAALKQNLDGLKVSIPQSVYEAASPYALYGAREGH